MTKINTKKIIADFIKENQDMITKEEAYHLVKSSSVMPLFFDFVKMYLVCETCGKTYHVMTFGSSLIKCSECGKKE